MAQPSSEQRNPGNRREGKPTGAGTSPRNDVADPHPADEEHPYDAPNPGGRLPAAGHTGPNDAERPFAGSKP
jgi:hypothetical protein